jgi:hypothetical protein
MRRREILVGVFCASVVGSGLLWGAERCDADEPASTPSASAPSQTTEFPKNLWTLDGFGSFTDRFAGTPLYMTMGTVGFNCYFVDNISVGCEMDGLYAPQPHDATGGGIAVTMRGHFLQGNGWTMYGDTALGLTLFDEPTPPGGSEFNFSVGVGAGFTVRMTERIDLMLGSRFFHISNAGLDGDHHNPSFNGVQGYVGLMFKL